MASEWREMAVEDIKARSENALATGPFGSSIGSRYFTDSGIPVIRGSNLSEDIGTRLKDEGLVFLSPEKAQEFSRSKVRKGDLVFTCWGTVNQVGLIDERAAYREYVISNKQMKLTPDPAKADSLFLYYLFSSPDFQGRIKNESIGSSVPGFNLGQLRAMRIVIPEPDEQRAIAHILGTLDDKIELNRRMNETLEAMARALFKSWFIDFDPVRRNAARARNQPSPPTPLPKGEGRHGEHYRGGYDFAGLLEAVRALRKAQTPAEDLFWELVRDRQFMGLKFRRQHQVGDYIGDFYCHEHRLVIELDGGIHSEKRKRDHKRDAWMKAQGLTVLRFQNEMLFDDPESVLAAICDVVFPSTSGRGAGGESVSEALFHPLLLGEGRGEGGVESHAFDHLFPDSFEDSELGEIPRGWRACFIRDLTSNIQYGFTQSASSNLVGPRFLRITDIQGGKVDWSTVPFCEVTPEEHERYRLKPGDVLVARTGASTGENIYLSYAPDAVFASYLVRFQFPDLANARLVGAFMRTQAYFEYVAGGIGGSAQPNASAQVLAGAQLVVPTPSIARMFSDLVVPLDLSVVANAHESRTLNALRDTLLPKLISGELRVKDAEWIVEIV